MGRLSLVALVVFVGTTVALHVLQPQLAPADVAISYYVHGASGWLLTVGLLALALASLIVTRVLAASLRGPGVRPGVWLLGAWSAGLVIGAVFQADPPGHWNKPPTVVGMIHGQVALLAFIAFPVATLLFARAFRRDRRWPWRPLLVLAIAAAVGLIAFMASLAPVFVRPGPPVLLGLTERVLLAVYVAWLALVAATLSKSGAS
jgi:hypothetical protein